MKSFSINSQNRPQLTDYPYINNTGSLKEFLTKVKTIGTPDTITQSSLPSLGFKSKNDRPIAKILAFIGFLDSSSKPNDKYRDFKLTSKSTTTMAAALKSAYAELYTLYPDAHSQSQDNLRDFFASKTSAGEQVIGKQISTFKVLAEFAEFDRVQSGAQSGEEKKETSESAKKAVTGVSPQIAINLQIQLPSDADPKTYEAIFKAMAEYLLKGST
jgi:Family of unknown function (DUF5343)